jgi:2-C-methyl-D-erythritol 4-phosphate cytidylyltransferase
MVILSPFDRHWGGYDWSLLPDKVEPVFSGGANRGQSVKNALAQLEGRAARDDWVLVHDAARPCLSAPLVEQFLDEIGEDPIGGLLAMPLADTLKRAEDTQRVESTVPRDMLWRAQTPQMFRYDLLRRGLDRKPDATDESQAIESLGHAPRLVQGENTNIKVTFAEDMLLAEMILQRRAANRL